MTFKRMANEDFERALQKAFWRKITTWLTGENNDLLPFDAVREKLPLKGQYFIGFQQVPIDQIVGSMGRYRDFDRAFLPKQKRTKDRWVNIDKAHYEDVELPPVELYKMGGVYFVKDGNHRVSVARERGQEFIDALVTEIEIPVPLTIETEISDLDLKREQAIFLEKTGILKIHPSAQIDLTLPGEYERLLEHISVHRWYLGEQRKAEVPYRDAVASWYDNVYTPLVKLIAEHELTSQFPGRTTGDLYLWIIEYLWYLREAYKEEYHFEEAALQFVSDFSEWPLGKLVNILNKATWVDYLILKQERDSFLAKTHINKFRPEARLELTMPGLYDKLVDHIDVHRWYLGVQWGKEVPYEEAVISWYDQVYMPLVRLIREQEILDEFPGRTESDLYLWIIEHQGFLKEIVEGEVPIEIATEHFAQDISTRMKKKGSK